MTPKLSQIQMSEFRELNVEDKSCSTTWVDLKTIVVPYANPKIRAPKSQKIIHKLRQNKMSELKET